MLYRPSLPPPDWAAIRSLARAGKLSVGVALIKKIKAGQKRFTTEVATEIHRVTDGEIPCWRLRPDLWSEGQVPPSLVAEQSVA